MKIKTIGYFFREGATSLVRNRWMAIASAATVAVTLMILGSSLLMVLNVDFLAGTIESKVELAIYLKEDVTAQRAYDIGEEIKKVTGVREVHYVSKADALAELRKNFEQKKGVLDALGNKNPLPDKYSVKMDKPEQVKPAAQNFTAIDGVDKVKYAQGAIEKLTILTKSVRLWGLVLVILLAMAAIFLISTTIRLTVFARRREINIMKYLGATDWFIRWPFILEGVIIGLIGSLTAVLVLFFAYNEMNKMVLEILPFVPFQRDMTIIYRVYELILAIGTVLGAIGSMISVRKFLKV